MASQATTEFLKWTLALVGLGIVAVGLMLWLMSGSTTSPVDAEMTPRMAESPAPEPSDGVDVEDRRATALLQDAEPAVGSVTDEPQEAGPLVGLQPTPEDQARVQTSDSPQAPVSMSAEAQQPPESTQASDVGYDEHSADDGPASLPPQLPSPSVTMMPPPTPDPTPPAVPQTLPVDPVVLRAQLHQAIKEHRVLNYRELWEALSYTDQDPDRPGYVILFYTGWSRSAQKNGGDPDQWNREHIWAKSRGDFGTRPGPGTDLHHIRATDVSVNGARGNLSFDEGGRLYRDGDGPTRCRHDDDSWEPDDSVKGDVARMMFYMDVRYEAGLDLELVDAVQAPNDKAPVHGKLSTLLRWHERDPVDEAERQRNNRIHEIQGNRNPFIDRPELAQLLWPSR